MTSDPTRRYENGLVTMANTRLLFNTLAELELFLGYHTIRSNGIKRCFTTPQKVRSAYRDCNAEVAEQAHHRFDLDWLLLHYERAWDFYRSHLSRRKDPRTLAMRLIGLWCGTYRGPRPSPSLMALHRQMTELHVDPAILLLILLHALPGYDSKGGDVTDIDAQFDVMTAFMKEFTADCPYFDELPVIKLASEEPRRCRLMLIFHTINILETYKGYSSPSDMAEMVNDIKDTTPDIDLNGLWCEGNSFWELQKASNAGSYFATRYSHAGERLLEAIHYTLHCIESITGEMIVYFLHPTAMKQRIKGRPYEDRHNAWYLTDFPTTKAPDALSLNLSMHSDHWPAHIDLRRPTAAEAERLNYELDTFTQIDPYADYAYTFFRNIYAITVDEVYVIDNKEKCFYVLPRTPEHCFDTITINDNIGILEIGGRRYLAIDDRFLYIPLTPHHLQKYSIKKSPQLTKSPEGGIS